MMEFIYYLIKAYLTKLSIIRMSNYVVGIYVIIELHWLTASLVWWSEFLAIDPKIRVRFSALPDFFKSSGSGTGSTQPRKYN
jgi:hypothetical protein